MMKQYSSFLVVQAYEKDWIESNCNVNFYAVAAPQRTGGISPALSKINFQIRLNSRSKIWGEFVGDFNFNLILFSYECYWKYTVILTIDIIK